MYFTVLVIDFIAFAAYFLVLVIDFYFLFISFNIFITNISVFVC